MSERKNPKTRSRKQQRASRGTSQPQTTIQKHGRFYVISGPLMSREGIEDPVGAAREDRIRQVEESARPSR